MEASTIHHTSLHLSLGSAKVAVQNNPVRPWETSGFPIRASIWYSKTVSFFTFTLAFIYSWRGDVYYTELQPYFT